MPRSINSSVADRLSEQDIFGPAPLFYGLDYKIVGSSVAQYTDRDSQPAPIVTWLETGDWQTKKMAWPSDPRDILIDRRHILVADEREGCLKLLDNQRPVQEVSSSLSTALSRFSNVDVIQPARDLGEKQDMVDRLREDLLGPTGQSWCDYYARADWLRQRQSWGELVELSRQVKARRFKPVNAVE